MTTKSNPVGIGLNQNVQDTNLGIAVSPGKYVVAVSGGVDSIVLLDILKNQPDLELVIAHFDHGIRADSNVDRQIVQDFASELGLTFVFEEVKLGPNASEAVARTARYKFLERTRQTHKARAVITAHHQDDVIETTLINILRGTNRKGLTSLSSRVTIIRPLLNVSKKDIRAYALSHKLKWREDSTNKDETYLRNYIRGKLLPKFDSSSRKQLVNIIEHTRGINTELDIQMINLAHIQPALRVLDRAWFISLPYIVGKEFMASWLRFRQVGQFDTKTIERLVVGAKVNRAGTLINISSGVSLAVEKDHLALVG